MGLRVGDDETYKFQPREREFERTRSKRKHFHSHRKNEPSSQSSRSAKSAASEIRGFMMHIRSGTNSTQASTQPTSYTSGQTSPRPSISSRPVSQASFAPSMSSEDGHSKKWWSARYRKPREPNSSGRQTPAMLTAAPNLDLWTGKERKHSDPYAHHVNTPKDISEPFNFQHHMHVQPSQVRRLAEASQNDLVAEFSAIRAAQSAKPSLNGSEAPQKAPSRCSYMALAQSVPSSFQVTARSSMHAPEPVSPKSEHGVHYLGSKGSFSMPFRDGKSPKLQQNPSMDFPKPMTISEDIIMEDAAPPPIPPRTSSIRPRDPRGGNLCTHCHSRVIETDPATESEGSPIHEHPRPEHTFSAKGLQVEATKTGLQLTLADDEEHEFKELSPEPRAIAQFPQRSPASTRTIPIRPVSECDEIRVSMNRSSINGGLFSSWAAASDSSDEECVGQRPQQRSGAQHRIAARLKQRAARNSKLKIGYQPPATPPPGMPLPRVPQNQSPYSKHCSKKSGSRNELRDFDVIEEEEFSPELSEASTGSDPVPTPQPVPETAPTRRPSVKNVRFKSDHTLIDTEGEAPLEHGTSLDRVQATLDDLHKNLSRLETDLSRRPSDASKPQRRPSDANKHFRKTSDPSQATPPRPNTADSKNTPANSGHRRHRTASSSGTKPSLADTPPLPATPHQPVLARIVGTHPGTPPPADMTKLHGPLPPLPPFAKPSAVNGEERHYSTGSATIPASIAVQ